MHRALIGLAWAALAPAVAVAQAPSGVVRGAVHDPRGAPIRGAVVGVPGTTLYTFTDAVGRYRLAPVAAGEIRLRAAAIGYSPASTTVTVADSARADFTLDPSPLELTPLDVVSTKVPQFAEPAASVAQVTEEEIARRAINTVDEAVDRAPGVQILNGQINIRGSTGYVQGLNSRVLLLVDGVPMNQGDRGGINWDLIPSDQIERVEILKGAGSSLYGSAALGGVVNLTTRDVPSGTHARLRVTGGAYADPPHPEWRFRNSTGLHDGVDVTGSYGTETAAGRLSVGGRHSDGYREQDARDHWQLSGKGRWQATPRTRLDVSGSWAVDQYQVPLSWCSRGECDDRGQVFQPFKVDTSERGARTDPAKVISPRSCGPWRRIDSPGRRAAPGCGRTSPTTDKAPASPAWRIGSESRCGPRPTPMPTARYWWEARGPFPMSPATFSARTPSRNSRHTARANSGSVPPALPRARASIISRSTRAR